MPIEIKELIVRAVVGPPSGEDRRPAGSDLAPDQQTALVEECVREVLRILRQNGER